MKRTMRKPKVLVVATSRKTRGGITAVVKAHQAGPQWREFHCHWIETTRDGPAWRKVAYFVVALAEFVCLLPDYDIVHIHMAASTSARRKRVFFELARLLRKKTIVHFHPSGEQLLHDARNVRLLRAFFLRADRVVVLSELWRTLLGTLLGVTERVTVLHNPCPVVERQPGLKRPVVLFAGSVIARKGYGCLIRAFARVSGRHEGWRLVVAGNGEVGKARALARSLGIGGRVDFPGWVSGERKARAFNEASIFCLASEGEGFPMAVLDAWAYGVPCVVTPVGGLPDIVAEGENALTFPVGDDGALAAQLDRLMADDALRSRMAEASLRLARTTFNIDTINRQLAQLYTEVGNKQ